MRSQMFCSTVYPDVSFQSGCVVDMHAKLDYANAKKQSLLSDRNKLCRHLYSRTVEYKASACDSTRERQIEGNEFATWKLAADKRSKDSSGELNLVLEIE